MADKKDNGFINRSSEEQAKDNHERATTPPASADPSNAQSLTGHTGQAEVVKDSAGRTVAAHTTTVVTDPTSDLAVQVPDPEVYPQANATTVDPLGVHGEPTPNEVFDGSAKASPADPGAGSKPASSKS